MKNSVDIKQQTIDLYKSLPQDRELRQQRIDVRDAVIDLNYNYFKYIASTTFVSNTTVTFEDKFNSAVLHFCECWWHYLWEGDDTHPGHRTDVSFTVFFYQRLQEMIRRELNFVKYSVRRTLCSKVSKQLGKSWTQVEYNDLTDPRVHLSVNEMESLKTILGVMHTTDVASIETYVTSTVTGLGKFEEISYKFNSIEELLITEMVNKEGKLTKSDLQTMSNIYYIPYTKLKSKLPKAEEMLHQRLLDELDIKEVWRQNQNTKLIYTDTDDTF